MSSKVHVNKPLSSRLIIELLDDNPDLEEIDCPRSLYERTAKTYIDALNELDIKINIVEHRGRPKVYDENLKKQIDEMIEQGLSPKSISKRLGIKQKSVYYLKSKKLKQGPESKYSKEICEKIVNMRYNNTSVKDISEKLNIPKRTVYYILQKENR